MLHVPPMPYLSCPRQHYSTPLLMNLCSAVLYCTVLCYNALCNATAQRSTAQHSTAQYCTVMYTSFPIHPSALLPCALQRSVCITCIAAKHCAAKVMRHMRAWFCIEVLCAAQYCVHGTTRQTKMHCAMCAVRRCPVVLASRHFTLPGGTVQHSKVQYSRVQYCTVLYSPVLCCAVLYILYDVLCRTALCCDVVCCGTIISCAVQCCLVLYSTVCTLVFDASRHSFAMLYSLHVLRH